MLALNGTTEIHIRGG